MAYTPPGISVSEATSSSLNISLASPATIALVGLSSGVIIGSEAITLSGTTPVTLAGVPTTATMVSGSITKIVDYNSPDISGASYVVTTDYTFNATTHQVTRVSSGSIPDGSIVLVTYTYTPADYFSPIRLDNMSDVEARFGTAWDTTGTAINSAISHGAQVAFENGAQEVVLQPLFYNNAGVKQEPNSTQHATAATWTDNFNNLFDIEDINLIIPIIGQSQASVTDSVQLGVIQAAQTYAQRMLFEGNYSVVIAGEDSSASSSVAQKSTIQSHASTLRSRLGGALAQQTVLLNISKLLREQPNSFGGTFYVGAQYAACGIAGMLASRPVSQPLTRKVLSGFVGVADSRSKAEKNADAAAGLLVLEQKAQTVQVRHGITLDTTSTAVREISIVRAKHRMIESLSETLDQLLGDVVADGNAPGVVADTVKNTLEALKTAQDIVDYGTVQARTTSLDPATIEVRFSYKPAFPINYINIIFSLDLTNQELSLPSTGAVAV
jgi:hypothetical protein